MQMLLKMSSSIKELQYLQIKQEHKEIAFVSHKQVQKRQ